MNNLVVTNYQEILERERFELSHKVTHEDFRSLICLIRLPKNEEKLTKCQIQKKQNTCNHHFMNGYLVQTKSGKEAIIGGECGDIYFNLNETFLVQRNKLKNDVDVDVLVSSITKQLDSINKESLKELENQIKNIGEKIRFLINTYPKCAKKSLQNMAKSKSTTVTISVDYSETDNMGRTEHHWTNENIGNIKGTFIWNYQDNIGHIFSLMKELTHTLPIIKADNKQNLKQLKKWSKILSYTNEIEKSLERAKSEYINFTDQKNILMTTLLTKNRDERLKIIEHHLIKKNASNAHTILSDFDKAISKEFQNRNFKLAA
ncbi:MULTISPECIES: hypothetical protein [unclassified Methylophaga]|mgnify:FL=1|jgi:iron-sulfur cluster repair protein YtfE (RIC family)|uniref:hypothetical protein n=1 Tax=unclassified Methylophaga TaxID=2629249 RepID=UPI000C937262|nr:MULTISPECIES: hypothetical protein [unclassified Methylophaga]MAK65606.1 hypothetical protein [Methylophaga sp.]MAY16329.1 hypothetical protein [Methylophaga sp.]HCD06596.1 hypothetical protein [Methylophaga sp.]|tara:strand:+ start:7703 stop:8656 length:954 start_codon:yes stop_codon:yes gene_type:complete